MTTKSLRLKVGSIYTKGPGKIYYFRYQIEGHRKTISLQTTDLEQARRFVATKCDRSRKSQGVGFFDGF